jgi:hypothetical protein
MIVDDFDIEGVTIGKAKADAPLVVDPDRIPPGTVAFQCFQAIGRRQAQVVNSGCGIQLPQAHDGSPQDIPRQSARFPGDEKPLSFGIGKRTDHFGL